MEELYKADDVCHIGTWCHAHYANRDNSYNGCHEAAHIMGYINRRCMKNVASSRTITDKLRSKASKTACLGYALMEHMSQCD